MLTTERALASAPGIADAAATVLEVPAGRVDEISAALRPDVGRRSVVALGGGRVIDTAKAIAGADGLGCAAIPTTLSGAEMTRFHRMPAGVQEFRLVRPALVVNAPELAASQPMPRLAASAMNALAHAVEALYTPLANPIACYAGLEAARSLARGLRAPEPSRKDLAYGAFLAGYASGSAGFAVHHAVCQTIVRLAGTPHAETNAVMLPHFVRMMERRAPEEIRALGSALRNGDDGAPAASQVSELAARAGNERLGELGFERRMIPDVIAGVLAHPALANTPRPPDEAELRSVLEEAI